MRKANLKAYKKHLTDYIGLSTGDVVVYGKLIDISDNCFLFNPHVQLKLTNEDDKIFNKSGLEHKTLELYINNPKTNIVIYKTTKKELKEYCETLNIVGRSDSSTYKKANKIGMHA